MSFLSEGSSCQGEQSRQCELCVPFPLSTRAGVCINVIMRFWGEGGVEHLDCGAVKIAKTESEARDHPYLQDAQGVEVGSTTP